MNSLHINSMSRCIIIPALLSWEISVWVHGRQENQAGCFHSHQTDPDHPFAIPAFIHLVKCCGKEKHEDFGYVILWQYQLPRFPFSLSVSGLWGACEKFFTAWWTHLTPQKWMWGSLAVGLRCDAANKLFCHFNFDTFFVKTPGLYKFCHVSK